MKREMKLVVDDDVSFFGVIESSKGRSAAYMCQIQRPSVRVKQVQNIRIGSIVVNKMFVVLVFGDEHVQAFLFFAADRKIVASPAFPFAHPKKIRSSFLFFEEAFRLLFRQQTEEKS